MAGGQLGAAESAAGAASPFGFMQQATTNDALQTPEQQLKAIYDQLNAVGHKQAQLTLERKTTHLASLRVRGKEEIL